MKQSDASQRAQHTPTPWSTGDDDACIVAMIENTKVSGGVESLRLATMETCLGEQGNADANAAFICLAANNFDKMEEALREIVSVDQFNSCKGTAIARAVLASIDSQKASAGK